MAKNFRTVSERVALPAAIEALMAFEGGTWENWLGQFSGTVGSTPYLRTTEWQHDGACFDRVQGRIPHSIGQCPWRTREVQKEIIFSFEGLKVTVRLGGTETAGQGVSWWPVWASFRPGGGPTRYAVFIKLGVIGGYGADDDLVWIERDGRAVGVVPGSPADTGVHVTPPYLRK